MEARKHGQSLIKLDGSGRLSLRSRQHLRPFTSYNPYLGTSADKLEHATDTQMREPPQSRPEFNSGLPGEVSPGRTSSPDSLFFSLQESPEPKSSEHRSPASDSTIQLSSGSETASPPTSSQYFDPRSPAEAHQNPETEAPKKARGRPKKIATGGSTGQCGGHGSQTGARDRSDSRSPELLTRRSARARAPPDRLQVPL